MSRLFAIYSDVEGKDDLYFIEISSKELENPNNFGVGINDILKVNIMGYNTVQDMFDDYEQDSKGVDVIGFIEDSFETACDEGYIKYVEYNPNNVK